MANSVKDLAITLEVIAGKDGLDPRQPSNLPEPPVKEYSKLIQGEIKGMRIGIVKEGFEWPNSEQDVNELVMNFGDKLKDLGANVDVISIPEHKLGYAIWTPIAIEGAVITMVMGEGLGWGWKGFYPTSLADFYSRARRAMADEFPLTVKTVILFGYYMISKYGSHYYFKAQNLARWLKSIYDKYFNKYDALLMPTTPQKAMKLIERPSISEYFNMALSMVFNTCPFDATGHPAINVPAGYSKGLPVGAMLVGRSFEDEVILKIAYNAEIKS
jgi:amidase